MVSMSRPPLSIPEEAGTRMLVWFYVENVGTKESRVCQRISPRACVKKPNLHSVLRGSVWDNLGQGKATAVHFLETGSMLEMGHWLLMSLES